jgi:NADH pyrophosphatase NudC (nudix superfamily)
MAEHAEVRTPSDRNEVIEVRWFEREEALRMMFDNSIVDGLSLVPLGLLLRRDELDRQGHPVG